MNRAELFARFYEYGKEIEVIDSRDFYDLLGNRDIITNISHYQPMTSVEVCQISLDGWDYYSYGVVYSVGWEGDHDTDSFVFRIKCYTKLERAEMIKMFTENNRSETDIALPADYFTADDEKLI